MLEDIAVLKSSLSQPRQILNEALSDKVGMLLPSSFYKRPAALVAWDLLGKYIINETPEGIVGGIIVETEAYLGKDDLACHVSRGLTPRNRIFYSSPPGTVYVFHLRGRYLVNVLTSQNEPLECVLLRAVEPVIGVEIMRSRRQTFDENLTSGPAKLTEALGITMQVNGSHITEGPVRILGSDTSGLKRGVSPRIGISKDKDYPLRYFLVGNRFVSRPSKIQGGVSFEDQR